MLLKTFYLVRLPFVAALIGAMTTLAFAPFQFWPLAIISPTLLLLLIHNKSAKQSMAIGYAWGLGQFITGISWVQVSIDNFGGMPKLASLTLMALLIGYLALYSGLFAWFLNKLVPQNNRYRYILAAPALWLICDWLRGYIMTGFPWLLLGYSQIDSPLGNFAPIGGVDLVTLSVMTIAGTISHTLINREWRLLIIPGVIFMTGFGLNAAHWVKPDFSNTTKIALVQGNIPQALKWLPKQRWPTIIKYMDLTRENWDADIIVWPEAAIPAFEYEIPSFLQNLDSAARLNNSTVITGIVNRDKNKVFYNSILTLGVTANGPYKYDMDLRYHKHHLLPFGEFVPFEDLLRPLAPLFNLPMSSFTAGSLVQNNLDANGHQLAPALCYEIIFNEQVRKNITDNTDFILTLSNDAWFGHSIGPLQHMEIARMRALELGKPVIRATNNGITAVTDYRGKVIKKLPQFETGVLRAEIQPSLGHTPFFFVGTWPLYIWVLTCFGFIIKWHYNSKRQRA